MVDVYREFAAATPEGPDIAHFRSRDVKQSRALLNRFYYPLTIGTPDGADGFALGAEVIQLGPLTVGQLSFAGAVTVVAAELDAYHVTMPTIGRVHTRHAGHQVDATPATGAVFGPGSPVYALHDARSAELDVKIERTALEEELSGLLGRPVAGRIDLAPSIDLSRGPGQSWTRLVRLLRNELQFGQSLLYQPMIAEQLRSCVLGGLLLSVQHRWRDELVEPAAAGPPRAIRRVLDVIHDEPERPFTVTDLARVAGLSVRSLQDGFGRHVGRAPMSYLREVRLTRARETLRRADPSQTTVAAVAHLWGFAHLGRFAATYRARFGQSPSDTLRGPH